MSDAHFFLAAYSLDPFHHPDPIGVPLAFYVWLRQFKARVDNPTIPEDEFIAKRKEDKFLHHHPIAAFALQFRPRFW